MQDEPVDERQIRCLKRKVARAALETECGHHNSAGSLAAFDHRRHSVVEASDDIRTTGWFQACVAEKSRVAEWGRRCTEGREYGMLDAHVAERAAAGAE